MTIFILLENYANRFWLL